MPKTPTKSTASRKQVYLAGLRKAKAPINDLTGPLRKMRGVDILRWGACTVEFKATPKTAAKVKEAVKKIAVVGKGVVFHPVAKKPSAR